MLGFVSGLLLMGVVLVSLFGVSLRAGLPSELDSLRLQRSLADSVVLDHAGGEARTFALVEPVESLVAAPPDLVEALFAVLPPSFYEPRANRAMSVMEASRRALAGEEPEASPLSVELARGFLAHEVDGFRSRARLQLLSSRLDVSYPVVERGAAWLQWVPLCGGRRGLSHVVERCLGPLDAWGPGEHALVAGAAVARRDLLDASENLLVARDRVADRLVVQGNLDPQAAATLPVLVPPPLPSSPGDAFFEEVLVRVRRKVPPETKSPVQVRTWFEPGTQQSLEGALTAAGSSWFVVDPTEGGILALGGDAEVAGGARELAAEAVRLVRGGQPLGFRLLRGLTVGTRDLREPRDRAEVVMLDEVEAWQEFSKLPESGGARLLAKGRCVGLAHPAVVAAACGAAEPPDVDLPRLLEELLVPASVAVPDRIWLAADGSAVRRDIPPVKIERKKRWRSKRWKKSKRKKTKRRGSRSSSSTRP